MSTDKYAQYISEQQRNLRVSGTNPVELSEKKKMSKDDIAGLAEPKGKFDHKDLAALRAKKHLKKEEVDQIEEEESVDEGMTRASKGKKASLVHTVSIKPGKVPYRGKGTIPKPQNINNSYELTPEEADYIEEAVGKGQLPSILKHHEDNMKHHQNMIQHHMMLADESENVGDHEGFDYHTSKAMDHEYDSMSHKRRFDHAASLSDKVKAMKQMKSAKKDMDAASEKLAKARENKRDY